ncbi:Hypothetical_protein [Hexamita inflata]|uniref:Hypothetical_protein n=1 Tax=Hexamita inflata TaxID=28002 RepID=A0AA86PFT9_9EUKA|nr:Hypothetical protein HINF_LOCUS26074 [Hexamita inflata]
MSPIFKCELLFPPTQKLLAHTLNLLQQRNNAKEISLVQDVPVQFLRFSQQSQFMKDFISKIYGSQAGLEKRIRGSSDWCTDAICNLQLVAQVLGLQGTSVFIFNWVNLNDFRYFLITKNSGGLFLSISTGSSR